jgi:CheY-like chemotaxis protein
VRSWVNKGWLAARTTPGGHRRFTPEAVHDFMRRSRQTRQEGGGSEPLRVLMVDDDAQFRGFLLEVLEGWAPAIAVEAAVDGFEAGLKVSEFQPDLILLDETMPGLNGASVCRRIKADPQHAGVRGDRHDRLPAARHRGSPARRRRRAGPAQAHRDRGAAPAAGSRRLARIFHRIAG